MSNICFHESAQIFWNAFFSVSFQRVFFYYSYILIVTIRCSSTTFAHSSNNYNNNFPTMQITWDRGFSNIKSEATVLSFFVKQLFWKFLEIS